MARGMSFTDIVSKPLRLLLKIIVNNRGSRIDNISYAVTSKQGAIPQIEQEPPIIPLPYPLPSNATDFDEDYYKSDGNTDGFCLFKVENALFRVRDVMNILTGDHTDTGIDLCVGSSICPGSGYVRF